jgi:hypothetical protein
MIEYRSDATSSKNGQCSSGTWFIEGNQQLDMPWLEVR